MHVIVVRSMAMATKSIQLAFRVEPDIVALSEELAALLEQASVTRVRPTQAEVMRAALRRGLQEMKAELIGRPRKRTPKTVSSRQR